jgi:hypothetical protein
VSDPVALSRRRSRGGAADRYEREDVAFHARVRAGFLAIAAAEPDRCAVVGADGSVDQVQAVILGIVTQRLGLASPDPPRHPGFAAATVQPDQTHPERWSDRAPIRPTRSALRSSSDPRPGQSPDSSSSSRRSGRTPPMCPKPAPGEWSARHVPRAPRNAATSPPVQTTPSRPKAAVRAALQRREHRQARGS